MWSAPKEFRPTAFKRVARHLHKNANVAPSPLRPRERGSGRHVKRSREQSTRPLRTAGSRGPFTRSGSSSSSCLMSTRADGMLPQHKPRRPRGTGDLMRCLRRPPIPNDRSPSRSPSRPSHRLSPGSCRPPTAVTALPLIGLAYTHTRQGAGFPDPHRSRHVMQKIIIKGQIVFPTRRSSRQTANASSSLPHAHCVAKQTTTASPDPFPPQKKNRT